MPIRKGKHPLDWLYPLSPAQSIRLLLTVMSFLLSQSSSRRLEAQIRHETYLEDCITIFPIIIEADGRTTAQFSRYTVTRIQVGVFCDSVFPLPYETIAFFEGHQSACIFSMKHCEMFLSKMSKRKKSLVA